MEHRYDLDELPAWQYNREPFGEASAKWSGQDPPPRIGDRVFVAANKMGFGTVRSYFIEHGYLGVLVKLDAPPAWFVKQNNGVKACHVYGIDLRR